MSRIVVAPEVALPADLRAEVFALQQLAWPDASVEPGPVHDPALDPVTMALVVDGAVVAALDVLSAALRHRGVTYRASGLSAVVTDPRVRGQGFASRLVAAARHAIRGGDADLTLFTSRPELRGLYVGAGFEVLDGTVLVGGVPGDALASDTIGAITYGDFVSPLARAHRDDFPGRDIWLFPGTIDRLW